MNAPSSPRKIRVADQVGEIWATFFFVGRIPWAPGTFGSLAALPLAWWVWKLPLGAAWLVCGLIFLSGCWGAEAVIRRTGENDHQTIVIDEVVGILITTSVAAQLWWQYALAFLFFRIFDIWKPWPVRYVDRHWHGGLGAMVDDVVAALMAAALLFLVLFYSASMVSGGAT